MAQNDDDLERELLLQRLSQSNTGVSGIGFPGGVAAPPLDPGADVDPNQPGAVTTMPVTPAAPPPSYALRGFEQSKLAADPSQQSEKYKIGNVMKQFDPKAGVTPEMLAALNALGIAKFSGSGDQLTVENTKNDPRFGRGGTADVVYGLKGQNADTAWQPWFVDDGGSAPPGGAPQGAGLGASGAGGSSIASLMPTDDAFYQRLQQQLLQILGGRGAVDREQLLKQLGA
jgi:hypothetical protein